MRGCGNGSRLFPYRRNVYGALMGMFERRTAITALWASAALFSLAPHCLAQAPQRTRLVMNDGSFQWVLRYDIDGAVVHYVSAEHNGEHDDIPLALVDIAATQKWAREHAVQKNDPQRTVLSPQLAKEEAQRAARTPEVVPGLKLPEELSFLALDQFNGGPELVPLEQKGSDLNAETAHDTLKQAINPSSLAHDIYDLRGPAADVQLHTLTPIFYVRVGNDDELDAGGVSALVVDTHGATGRATPEGGAASSTYVLEKLKMRSDSREVDSFRVAWLHERNQPDIIELDLQPLPGGKWASLTPAAPLERGEYALIEVMGHDSINLDVWDFGIQPNAPESSEAIRPDQQKPIQLERRRPE